MGIYPTTYPVMLIVLDHIKHQFQDYTVLWACSSMLIIAASYMLIVGFLMGAVCGVISTVVISRMPTWYAGWLACLVALILWNDFLFRRRNAPKPESIVDPTFR